MEWNEVYLRKGLKGCECPQGKNIILLILKPQGKYTQNEFPQLGF